MIRSTSIFAKFLSALLIASAMATFTAHPTAAQTATNLKCKGCVNSRDIKNGGIRSRDIGNGQVKNADLADGSVTGSKVANESLGAVDLSSEAGADYDLNPTTGFQFFALGADDSYRTVTITAPSAGHVILNASGWFFTDSFSSAFGRCSISRDTNLDVRNAVVARVESPANYHDFGITWAEAVAAGSHTWHLACDATTGSPELGNPQLTAIFVATQY